MTEKGNLGNQEAAERSWNGRGTGKQPHKVVTNPKECPQVTNAWIWSYLAAQNTFRTKLSNQLDPNLSRSPTEGHKPETDPKKTAALENWTDIGTTAHRRWIGNYILNLTRLTAY